MKWLIQPCLLAMLSCCDGGLDQRLAIVTEPRVLAITSEPAETQPGMPVTYTALLAAPDGPLAAVPSWALCTAPKPPTDDNAVSDVCIGTTALVELGTASSIPGTVPTDACIQFGPDVPAGGFRPRDPDPTGGYYQPVRADAPPAPLAFGFTRVTCNLPTAPAEVAHDYQLHYLANQPPSLAPLELDVGGVAIMADAIPAGATITLAASWPESAVESYLSYDPQSQTLVTRREAMRVSWFATAGNLEVDASAVDEDDPATRVTTTWRAPTTPGAVWLWLVLRDSRGGIATQTIAATIR